MSQRAAAKLYKVPKTTLRRNLEEEEPERHERGPVPILGEELEEAIVSYIKKMAQLGFPITRKCLQEVGRSLARVASENGNPRAEEITSGKKWLELFLKRHQCISLRTAEHVSNAQASVSENDIREHFEKLERRLTEEGLIHILRQPDRVFNTDETSMSLNPSGQRVLATRGARNVYSRGGSDKESVTLLVTGNAAGALAPTAIVLRRKTLPVALTDLIRAGFYLLNSDKGWQTGKTFLEYLENSFTPFLVEKGIRRPVLLFLDNHRSHLVLDVVSYCERSGIVLLPLLPNATHICWDK
ncbi:uncharacterized protein LOC100907997 [Galendromus occidentalis]|uniref:Uncharacterized protein LOC100907997 n=1 Tax=Galendromus occidentalis TaxID=34638 RepID=A0AAJ6QWF5_9ACAR|nr:uncharacterized protein LOC100907997 [Galendromus occidentalis]